MSKSIIALFLLGLMFIAFGIGQGVIAQTTSGLERMVEPVGPERIATGFTWTAGLIWNAEGYLLFSDIPNNTIYKWTPNGKVETLRSPSGHSNGLTFDKQGRLIVCEYSNRRVSRTEPDGTIVTLANEYEGKRLNSPNDIVVKSDGSIYFTDPPYGLRGMFCPPMAQQLTFQGIYRIMPTSNSLELLVDDIYRPNGLAFSPDEKVLYVANTEGQRGVYAFDIKSDGTLANRRVFVRVYDGYPDGIKVDKKGNLYLTLNSIKLRIYDSSGKHLGDIITPEQSVNCAFGGSDNKTLFIAARTSVYRIQLKVP